MPWINCACLTSPELTSVAGMIRVQRADVGDEVELRDVLEILYHREPADGERLTQILEDPDFLLLRAELEGASAGYLYGRMLDRLDGTRLLLIYDITVGVEYRRKGVGSELMRSALAHAREVGASGCWLIADEDNEGARAFYEHLDGEEWPAVGFRWKFG